MRMRERGFFLYAETYVGKVPRVASVQSASREKNLVRNAQRSKEQKTKRSKLEKNNFGNCFHHSSLDGKVHAKSLSSHSP